MRWKLWLVGGLWGWLASLSFLKTCLLGGFYFILTYVLRWIWKRLKASIPPRPSLYCQRGTKKACYLKSSTVKKTTTHVPLSQSVTRLLCLHCRFSRCEMDTRAPFRPQANLSLRPGFCSLRSTTTQEKKADFMYAQGTRKQITHTAILLANWTDLLQITVYLCEVCEKKNS